MLVFARTPLHGKVFNVSSTVAATVGPPMSASPWRVGVAGLCTLAICYGFARYGYGLFLPTLQAEFGGSAGALGAVASIGYAGELAAVLIVGTTAGRLPARWPVAIGLACAGVGMALIAAAPNVVVLAIGVAISGTSPGWVWAPYADAVQQMVREGGRDRAMSLISTGTTFGVLAAGPAALIAGDNSWRWAWMSAAGLAVVVLCWNLATLPSVARCPPPGTSSLIQLTRRPHARRLFMAAALSGAVGAGYWSYAGVAVATGSGDHFAAILWTIVGTAGTLGIWTGQFVHAVGLRVVFLISQAALITSVAVLWLAPVG